MMKRTKGRTNVVILDCGPTPTNKGSDVAEVGDEKLQHEQSRSHRYRDDVHLAQNSEQAQG